MKNRASESLKLITYCQKYIYHLLPQLSSCDRDIFLSIKKGFDTKLWQDLTSCVSKLHASKLHQNVSPDTRSVYPSRVSKYYSFAEPADRLDIETFGTPQKFCDVDVKNDTEPSENRIWSFRRCMRDSCILRRRHADMYYTYRIFYLLYYVSLQLNYKLIFILSKIVNYLNY